MLSRANRQYKLTLCVHCDLITKLEIGVNKLTYDHWCDSCSSRSAISRHFFALRCMWGIFDKNQSKISG